MKTRIEIIRTTISENCQTRRVSVGWCNRGTCRTLESSMLEDTAPPEKVAHVLRELATRIERDCRGAPHPPGLDFKSHNGPENWAAFVQDVNRTDWMLNSGSLPLRYDPKLEDLNGTAPLFEFMGFKVFRR